MDFDRLSRGERIAGIAGVALFIVMFFAWYDIDIASANAWESFSYTDIICFLAAVTAIALAVTSANRTELGLPVALSAIVTGLGALATLLVLYRILNPPGEGEVDRSIGIFLGLIAAGAVTYGGYTAMQEEGVEYADRGPDLR